MFLNINEIQRRQEARDASLEPVRNIVSGYVIAVNGDIVGDREGLIWFKAIDDNSEPFQVFYNGTIGDLRPNMFVRIERNPKAPARWQIIQFDTGLYFDDQSTYETLPSLSVVPGKEEYEWPAGRPGALALNISTRQVTDFAARPTSPSSMRVLVYSGFYPGATDYEYFEGPIHTADMTARIPGTSGEARLVAISVDTDGNLVLTNGTTFVNNLPMPTAALPNVGIDETLISSVRLVNGMTSIVEDNFTFEMRPVFGATGGKPGLWSIVPATSTDILYDQGNVGIGSAPATDVNLHVLDSDASSPTWAGADLLVLERNGVARLHIHTSTATEGGLWFTDTIRGVGRLNYDHNADEMTFYTSSTRQMVIDANGQVGINIISPSTKLQIVSATSDPLPLQADREVVATSGGQEIARLRIESTGTAIAGFGSQLSFASDNLAGVLANRAAIIGGIDGASNIGFLQFQTTDSSNTLTDRMKIDGSGDIGINVTSPSAQLHIDQSGAAGAQPVLFLDQGDVSEQCIQFSSDATDQDINLYTVNVTGTPTYRWDESEEAFSQNKGLRITSGELTINAPTGATGEQLTVRGDNVGGNTEIGFYAGAGDTTDDSTLSIYGLGTPGSTTNRERLIIQYDQSVPVFRIQAEANGTGTLRPLIIETEGNSNQLYLDTNGRVGINAGIPSAQLHIDQAGAAAAIPVAYFDQADISEEMFEFATTIGVGNAIEAVGAKTLTTTHFIKVTLPGALTRYFPVGTIA